MEKDISGRTWNGFSTEMNMNVITEAFRLSDTDRIQIVL